LRHYSPAIDLSQVVEYFIEAKNTDDVVVASTTTFINNCCCPDDKIRIHFLNYCGTYDAINFLKPVIEHDDVSSQFKNGLRLSFTKNRCGVRTL